MALGEAQAGATVDPWAGQITRSGRVGRRPDRPHQQPALTGVRARWTAPATASANNKVILWHLTDPARPRRLGQPLSDHRQHFGGVHLVTLSRTAPGAPVGERGAQSCAPRLPPQPAGGLYLGACLRVLGLRRIGQHHLLAVTGSRVEDSDLVRAAPLPDTGQILRTFAYCRRMQAPEAGS